MDNDNSAITTEGEDDKRTAVKPFKQQSTFQASSGNNVEEEKWQMGRRHCIATREEQWCSKNAMEVEWMLWV